MGSSSQVLNVSCGSVEEKEMLMTSSTMILVVLTKIMLQDLELLTLATCQQDNFVPVDYKYSHLLAFSMCFDHVGLREK